EPVQAHRQETAHRARLAVARPDGRVRDETREPAALEPHPTLFQREARRREPLDGPEDSEERQRQDEQARVSRGGDEHDGEKERSSEADTDPEDAGDDALTTPERRGKGRAGGHDDRVTERSGAREPPGGRSRLARVDLEPGEEIRDLERGRLGGIG